MTTVCHMTSAHKRNDTRIFLKECVSLAEHGFCTYLVVSDLLDDETCKGVHIVSTKYSAPNRVKRILHSARAVYRQAVKLDSDIYHIHDPELLPYGLKLKRQGKKVVFDSHEIYYYQIKQKEYIPAGFRYLLAKIYKCYENYVLKRLDAVIVPCTICGENYFEDVAKKTVFLDNRPKRDEIQMVDYEEKKQPFRLCHVGSISVDRGIRDMTMAAKATRTSLILGGNMDVSLREELMKEGLLDNVDDRGMLQREQVQKVYDESHAGLSLIHNVGQYALVDNLPTKVWECMMAGIPVIISGSEQLKSFFNKYKVGIVVNLERPQSIVDAINYLKNNPEEAKKMGLLGREIAMNDFCWEVEADKLVQLYSELIQ